MIPIQWETNLETGHTVVDTQHQAIFKAFNRLLEAMNQGKGADEVRKTLDFLKDYTQRHFAMEEGLMEKSAYPDMLHHQLLHKEFISDLERFVDRMDRGASVTISVMQFVKTWLLQHIQIEDKKLANYLAASKGLGPEGLK